MSDLSGAEQSCLLGNVDSQRLMALLSGPEFASPEETVEFVQCLEDETLLRLFLTGLIGQTRSLSEETSTCVRSGFADFDLRATMLSSASGPGGEEAAMVGSMAGFFLTLSCLNEEEWRIASPTLGLGPDDREGVQCVTNELGGPEGVAAALQSDAGPPTAFISAAMACNLQMMEEPPG